MKDRTIFLFSLCCCAQLCLTLCGLMDCSPPGSSVLGIFQARMLKWGNASSPGDLPDSEGYCGNSSKLNATNITNYFYMVPKLF